MQTNRQISSDTIEKLSTDEIDGLLTCLLHYGFTLYACDNILFDKDINIVLSGSGVFTMVMIINLPEVTFEEVILAANMGMLYERI